MRPRLIWGRDDTLVLAAFVDACKTGRFKWIDKGAYLTSTVHVRNVCEGMVLAAERYRWMVRLCCLAHTMQRGEQGEAYFLTDGAPRTFREHMGRLLESQVRAA